MAGVFDAAHDAVNLFVSEISKAIASWRRKAEPISGDFIPNRTVRSPSSQRLKGQYGRRIIRSERIGDRIYEYHATKGWRSRRA